MRTDATPDADTVETLHPRGYPIPGTYRVRRWGCHLVLVTDLDRGVSVTNAAEDVLAWCRVRWPGCTVVEHYPPSGALPNRCAVLHLDGGGRLLFLEAAVWVHVLAGLT